MSPNEFCDKKTATAKITRAVTSSVSFFFFLYRDTKTLFVRDMSVSEVPTPGT